MAKDRSSRTILWYVAFLGFAINYMYRVNLNIAIVAMVRPRKSSSSSIVGECYEPLNYTHDNTTSQVDFSGFDWDEREQGMLLGSFFWLHWLTQLPGGVLAQRLGGKNVYGLSQLAATLLCFTMPYAASFHIYAIIFMRFLQGTICGVTWPAMHTMTGKWIPPNERSNFVTAYLGSSVGAALTYPMCGFLIDWFGWESVFYVTGAIGVAWYISWYLLIFESPAEHPRISDEEKQYIQSSLGQSSQKEQLIIPWKPLLLSRPLWMNVIAQWGGIWGLLTILTQAPTYFKLIHGWDVRAAGFLSGLPHLLRAAFALCFSRLGDFLLRSNKMSRTNVRKLATFVCTTVQGLFILGLALAGCDSTAAIVLVTAATGVNGAVTTGPLASVVDLAPNFSGISLGLCGLIAAMPGFISPAVVGALTLNNQTIEQWKIVFLISAGMLISTGLMHLFFSESEVQDWNFPKVKHQAKEELLQPLKQDDFQKT